MTSKQAHLGFKSMSNFFFVEIKQYKKTFVIENVQHFPQQQNIYICPF